MTRGRYAQRADSRLKVLESQALQQAHTKIKELENQLQTARGETNELRAQLQSKAMAAAATLSSREKRDLRDRIASLEHKFRCERVRVGVLMWELMHRHKFNRPGPNKLYGSQRQLSDADVPETSDQLEESFDYWCAVHWDIAAVLGLDWDEIQEFDYLVVGYHPRLQGDRGWSIREATRNLEKGRIRDALMKREFGRRAYYERIWKARQAQSVAPIEEGFNVAETPQDIREGLVKKMKKRTSGQA